MKQVNTPKERDSHSNCTTSNLPRQNTDQTPGIRIMRIKGVCEITGLSRTSIWRKLKEGTFPVPVRLGANAIGWYSHEIEEWLSRRPRVPINQAVTLFDV